MVNFLGTDLLYKFWDTWILGCRFTFSKEVYRSFYTYQAGRDHFMELTMPHVKFPGQKELSKVFPQTKSFLSLWPWSTALSLQGSFPFLDALVKSEAGNWHPDSRQRTADLESLLFAEQHTVLACSAGLTHSAFCLGLFSTGCLRMPHTCFSFTGWITHHTWGITR